MKNFYILFVALFVVNGTMAQWTILSSGTTQVLQSVNFTDAYKGYAVGGAGIILKTIDGGTTWDTLSIGTNIWLSSVCFPDEQTGYATGVDQNWNGIILKTIDEGATWDTLLTGTPRLNSVCFPNVNTGYAVGTWGTILKTIDGGSNWTTLSSGTTYILRSVYLTDSDTGYAVGVDFLSNVGIILITTNGFTSWTAKTVGYESTSLFSVYFPEANTGYAVGHSGTIIKTTNGFTSYTTLSSGTTYHLNSVYFTDNNTGYVVGGDNNYPYSNAAIILKTIDGGTTWTELPSGTTDVLNSVYFTDTDTGYVVGVNGTILKTINGGGYPVGNNDLPYRSGTLKIFPNPTSTTITIETPTRGSLSILNSSGQQLLHYKITEPITTIDVSSLKSGVYFVRLTGERTVQVGKFIKP